MKNMYWIIIGMLVTISVLSIKNYFTGQWNFQYAFTNGAMAIVMTGLYSAYTKALQGEYE